MRQILYARTYAPFGLIQGCIIVLTLITALFHLHLASSPDDPLRIWFLLNGLGYLVLLAALYLLPDARFRRIVRYLLITYATITIICWLIIARPYDPADFPIKIDELILICLLFTENAQMRARQI